MQKEEKTKLELPIHAVVKEGDRSTYVPTIKTNLYDLNTGKKIGTTNEQNPFFIDSKYVLLKKFICIGKNSILMNIRTGKLEFYQGLYRLTDELEKRKEEISSFDYLPKHGTVEDAKYLLIILPGRLQVWDRSTFTFRREIAMKKSARVFGYGSNLLVIYDKDQILIYSAIGGELVKKLTIFKQDIDFTFILPNGRLGSILLDSNNFNSSLIEWNIEPSFPTVRGDGKYIVIDFKQFNYMSSIFIPDSGGHYFILSSSPVVIYSSKTRKTEDLYKYLEIPREEKKLDRVMSIEPQDTDIRHIYPMYDSVVMIVFHKDSVIYDIAEGKEIKRFRERILNLFPTGGETFIFTTLFDYIDKDGKDLITLSEIDKRGSILRYFPSFHDIHSILPIPEKKRKLVNDVIYTLNKYINKNLVNIVKKFIVSQ